MIAAARIKKEFKQIDELSKCKLEILNDNYMDIKGEFEGPRYEGGIFKLELKIPEGYPYQPPKVKFITKIWHPNISSESGKICLDVLDSKWSAVMNLCSVLLSVQSLLESAVPDSALDAVVGRQYINNFSVFEKTARHWTNVYAGSSLCKEPEYDKKVEDLARISGCTHHVSRVALSSHLWNAEEALNFLENKKL